MKLEYSVVSSVLVMLCNCASVKLLHSLIFMCSFLYHTQTLCQAQIVLSVKSKSSLRGEASKYE